MNTPYAAPPPAIVLFAHGSRDPLWAQPIEALAQRFRERMPQSPVVCAYLELMQPTLENAVCGLLNRCPDVREVHILPVFFGMGRHAREDTPVLFEALQSAHPQVRFHRLPAVGEHVDVLEAITRSTLQMMQQPQA